MTKIVTQQELLLHQIKIINIHAKRLFDAHSVIVQFLPLTAEKLDHLTVQQLSFIDMMTFRFSKVQDSIGSKIFPIILNLLQEEAPAFIDKLNKLEQLGYITSADWWISLRELRNQIAHDYPDEPELVAQRTNDFAQATQELLAFWQELVNKIQGLLPRNA